MRILAGLLSLPAAQTDGYYVWPRAHAGEPTEPEWEQLDGVYDAEQLAELKRAGSYLGYRVGITESGEWRYFVAGD